MNKKFCCVGWKVVAIQIRQKRWECQIRFELIQFSNKAMQNIEYKNFHQDFVYSMYAAWTTKELASQIPINSKRDWYQIIPLGNPFFQFIISTPKNADFKSGRISPYDNEINHQVPKMFSFEYLMGKLVVKFGKKIKIN